MVAVKTPLYAGLRRGNVVFVGNKCWQQGNKLKAILLKKLNGLYCCASIGKGAIVLQSGSGQVQVDSPLCAVLLCIHGSRDCREEKHFGVL